MIDLLMDVEQEVTLFLERMTGGPATDIELAEDASFDAYFAMAGGQVRDTAQRPAR